MDTYYTYILNSIKNSYEEVKNQIDMSDDTTELKLKLYDLLDKVYNDRLTDFMKGYLDICVNREN